MLSIIREKKKQFLTIFRRPCIYVDIYCVKMLIPGLEGQKSSSPQRWRRGVRRYGLIMTKGPNIEINPARKSFNHRREIGRFRQKRKYLPTKRC